MKKQQKYALTNCRIYNISVLICSVSHHWYTPDAEDIVPIWPGLRQTS